MLELFTENGIWAVLITAIAFQLGRFLQKKTGWTVCNPLLISVAVLIPFLLLTGIPNESYQSSMSAISWLMTPCTICFAIPMYRHLQALKGRLWAVLAGVVAGTAGSLLSVGALCLLFRLDAVTTWSLLPKSVTTAIAQPLSESMGGLAPLTTAVVAVTGLVGAVTGPLLCRLLRLTDPVAVGVAYGTASHVIGTTKATEADPVSGAVSSLSLIIAGLLTAVIFPFLPV